MSIKRTTKADRTFDAINIILLLIVLVIELYPLYFTVIASISDPYSVVNGKVFVWPKGFTLDAYKFAFGESRIW